MKHQLERGQTEIHVVLPKLKFVIETIEQIKRCFQTFL